MPTQPITNPKQFIQGAPVLHVPDVEATAGTATRVVVSTRNTFGRSGEVQRNGFVVTNAHNAIAGIPIRVALSKLELLAPRIQ